MSSVDLDGCFLERVRRATRPPSAMPAPPVWPSATSFVPAASFMNGCTSAGEIVTIRPCAMEPHRITPQVGMPATSRITATIVAM